MATMKQIMAKEIAAESLRQENAQARTDHTAYIHDQKVSSSAVMYKNTKITSCSSILQKNGQAVCIAFNN